MEENICHFLDNVLQNSQGRYTVKLQVREQRLNNNGDSREAALKRLRGIERYFKRDPTVKKRRVLKFNTRRFLTNIRHWDICDATHCGRINIVLSSPPLRLQNGRANIENPYCIRCILPQQFHIIKRHASSGTDRSTRFDLNFDAFLFFRLYHHR